MVSRVWVINSVLAIALAICMSNIWDVWHTSTKVFPGNRSAVNEKEPMPKKKSPESTVRRESAYQSVVEKNLFSPDRMADASASEMIEPEIADVRISGEKIVLYGVIMADEYKKALINVKPAQKIGGSVKESKSGTYRSGRSGRMKFYLLMGLTATGCCFTIRKRVQKSAVVSPSGAATRKRSRK